MRVVAGKYGGRRLSTPKNNMIRPTSDKVRQAIFNSLKSRSVVEDAIVLDTFCGSGALGVEALSQGATHCTFIDKNNSALKLAKENIEMVGAQNDSDFILFDSTKLKMRADKYQEASLVFLDPPYNKDMLEPTISALISGDWLMPSCFFVIETGKSEEVIHDKLEMISIKKYGDTLITYAQLIL